MQEARQDSAAIKWEGDDQFWWITGGFNGYNFYLRSTETFDALADEFSRDILLPGEFRQHNLVNVNSTHTVLLGGMSGTDEVYYIEK